VDARTVLVVEDEPDIGRIIGLALKLIGRWNVVACQTPDGIDEALGRARPDLILLDRLLSGTDGLDVCRRLKADPATAEIPIIFLSAKCTERDREDGKAAGAAGYLAKPFDPMELADQIRDVLAGA
jgi:two-component system, OmpR family, response regulator